MSCGKQVEEALTREFVMSEASTRKQAVWIRAGTGVVGRWVVRKAESHVGFGVSDLVVVSWAEIWAAGLDIVRALSTGGFSFAAEFNAERYR